MNRHYDRQSIKRLSVTEMKEQLKEWGIPYDIYKDFGANRYKYEYTILHNPQNFPINPLSTTKMKSKNKSKTSQRNRKKRDISDEDVLDHPTDSLRNKNRIRRFGTNTNKNKNKNSKMYNNEGSTSDVSRDESVEILPSHGSTDDFWNGYNKYQQDVNERLVLSKIEREAINKLGLNSTQIKQMFQSWTNVMLLKALLETKDDRYQIHNIEGKLLGIKVYIDAKFANFNDHGPKDAVENKCNDLNSGSSERLKFHIKWDPENPDYKQFNVLFNTSKYELPKLYRKVSYAKRYNIKLELIVTLNNYKNHQYQNEQTEKKKRITLNQCYPFSASALHYRHFHFLLLILDEDKYEETIEDTKNWMKATETLSQEIIKIADGLTDEQRKNYKFSVPEEIIAAYNSLFGDIWCRIDKLRQKVNGEE